MGNAYQGMGSGVLWEHYNDKSQNKPVPRTLRQFIGKMSHMKDPPRPSSNGPVYVLATFYC